MKPKRLLVYVAVVICAAVILLCLVQNRHAKDQRLNPESNVKLIGLSSRMGQNDFKISLTNSDTAVRP